MTQAEQEQLKIDVALPLIKENGKAITLISPSSEDVGTDYVPGQGFTTPSTPSESYGFGVEIEMDTSTMDATLIAKTEKAMMCTEINKPTPKIDKLLVEGIEYNIHHMTELKPGNVSFFYTLYLGV